ncbi:MAG: alpha/beta hydrolase [Chlamydiota bacterium]
MYFWKKRLNYILNTNSQVLDTSKGPVEYAIYGHGPIVVGMHGAPGGYDQIICLGEMIAKEGFELIGWSRPGYLRTPLHVGKTIEEQADVLAELLDHLLIDKIALLAISAGGPSALQFAIRHPDRISALIMEAAVTKTYKPEFIEKNKLFVKIGLSDLGLWLLHWMFRIAPKKTLEKFLSFESSLDSTEIKKLSSSVIKDTAKMEFLSKILQSLAPMSRRSQGFYNDLKQLQNMKDIPYEKIQCPTLIIHGTSDKDVPLEHAEELSQKIPHAEFLKIEKGTHLLNLSNLFQHAEEKIIQFLRDNS